jgi:hypothetical protein
MMSVTLVPMVLASRRLLGEAWEHRRQRQRTLFAVLAVGVVAVAVLSFVGSSGQSLRSSQPIGFRAVGPASVLKRSFVFFRPDHAIPGRCVAADPFECDSLSVTLTLKRPAVLVSAWVNARATNLRRGKLGIHVDRSSGIVFSGVFNPPAHPDSKLVTRPGTRTEPSGGAEYVKVRLRIVERDGAHVTTSFSLRRLKVFDAAGVSSTSVKSFGS